MSVDGTEKRCIVVYEEAFELNIHIYKNKGKTEKIILRTEAKINCP
jgi:hypothetical protein